MTEHDTHKITSAELIPHSKGFAVRFEFDDGTEELVNSGTKEAAEWDAYDRIGEELPVGMKPQLRSAEQLEELKEYRREHAIKLRDRPSTAPDNLPRRQQQQD